MTKSTANQHMLYEQGDQDAPEQLKDRNGEIVLDQCRICGKAESELLDPCVPTAGAIREMMNDLAAWKGEVVDLRKRLAHEKALLRDAMEHKDNIYADLRANQAEVIRLREKLAGCETERDDNANAVKILQVENKDLDNNRLAWKADWAAQAEETSKVTKKFEEQKKISNDLFGKLKVAQAEIGRLNEVMEKVEEQRRAAYLAGETKTSDLQRLFAEQTKLKLAQTEYNHAAAKIDLANRSVGAAKLLSQHEPLASLGINREVMRALLAFVVHNNDKRLERDLAALKEKES